MYDYKAKVLRVIDGDTIEVEIDLGFNLYYNTKVRLAEVNTPERGQPDYDKAKEFVVNFCKNCKDIVYLKTAKTGDDKYGRYLAYVFDDMPTVMWDIEPLNDHLTRLGWSYKK